MLDRLPAMTRLTAPSTARSTAFRRITAVAWLRLVVVALMSTSLLVQAADFGDAPDSHENNPDSRCGFPSLSASGGARHVDTSWAWLGRSVTDEGDARVTDRD